MSLDVYLENSEGTVLYTANITHNLNTMAEKALKLISSDLFSKGLVYGGDLTNPADIAFRKIIEAIKEEKEQVTIKRSTE